MDTSIEVTVVDAPSALPSAASVGGEQGKRLCRKAALDSAPLKVGSGFFRNEFIPSRGLAAKLLVHAYVHAKVDAQS
jgi:hypothetical protein